MYEKVQVKGKEHLPSLFHHILIKVMVLHQLQENYMTWDSSYEAALQMPIITTPSQQQTMSPTMQEVGSSSKVEAQ